MRVECDDFEPADPVGEAIDRVDPRTAARALIAGYRAGRDAIERELHASREQAERLISGIERWIEGGDLPDYVRAFCAAADAANVTPPSGCDCCGQCECCRVNAAFLSYGGAFGYDDFASALATLIGCDRESRSERRASDLVCGVRGECDDPLPLPQAASDRVHDAADAAVMRALGALS